MALYVQPQGKRGFDQCMPTEALHAAIVSEIERLRPPSE
jgi:hypothetical protein